MNRTEPRYSQYALTREMMDTIDVIEKFDVDKTRNLAATIGGVGRLMLTGEGSSRIFPAKNAIRKARRWGLKTEIATDGGRQCAQYDLRDWAVFGASNSGRTTEIITLMNQLAAQGHAHRYGLTANEDTALEKTTIQTSVLTCGWEQAVAATKSVVEQALFHQSIISHIAGRDMKNDLRGLSQKFEQALAAAIPPSIIEAAIGGGTIYFAGWNDGVAEELTLKTNEITRRKSDFLEGTYAAHGIEEVMTDKDLVIIVDPIESDMDKFKQVLVDGVGMSVLAIATHDTPFVTMQVPDAGEMNPYVFLAAGWNLLVEIGLALGVNLDKAERARKVGNEIQG